jgi:hypothetical protein
VVNSDENKTFGAVFRTPVSDSTGIPHILEHSVLCGSRKYPIKEPFVELMKGSLNTFLNAFTYPDRTCYPVASTNTQVRRARGTQAARSGGVQREHGNVYRQLHGYHASLQQQQQQQPLSHCSAMVSL